MALTPPQIFFQPTGTIHVFIQLAIHIDCGSDALHCFSLSVLFALTRQRDLLETPAMAYFKSLCFLDHCTASNLRRASVIGV